MKICYLAAADSPLTQRWIWSLMERGHHVVLLARDPVPDWYAQRGIEVHSIAKPTAAESTGQSSRPNVPIGDGRQGILGRLGGRLYNWLSAEITWSLDLEACARRARKIICHLAPDLVHGHYVSTYGYIAARTGFHPLVLTAMGSDVLIRPQHSLTTRMMLRYALPKADAITCTSKFLASQTAARGDIGIDRITVFPRGTNLNVFRPLVGSSQVRETLGWRDNLILIMTRNFRPVYGIEYFIDALPAIVRQVPEARIIFVGAGPTQKECQRRARELGLEDYVHFVGRVEGESLMAEYLNAADIYVTTSLSDGTSNSLLEAMACGLPVVVSDAPSYFEWVTDNHNGYIVPRQNVSALVSRIVNLLKNETLRREMGERTLRVAQERAGWNDNFFKLETLYGSVVKRHYQHSNSSKT